MNRRSVLMGLLALPMGSTGALAAIPRESVWVTTTNKLGLPVTYTKALAADLWAVHGIDCEKLMKNMCGTSFHIEKKLLGNKKNSMAFALYTNDERDGYVNWIEGQRINVMGHVIRSQSLNQKRYMARTKVMRQEDFVGVSPMQAPRGEIFRLRRPV